MQSKTFEIDGMVVTIVGSDDQDVPTCERELFERIVELKASRETVSNEIDVMELLEEVSGVDVSKEIPVGKTFSIAQEIIDTLPDHAKEIMQDAMPPPPDVDEGDVYSDEDWGFMNDAEIDSEMSREVQEVVDQLREEGVTAQMLDVVQLLECGVTTSDANLIAKETGFRIDEQSPFFKVDPPMGGKLYTVIYAVNEKEQAKKPEYVVVRDARLIVIDALLSHNDRARALLEAQINIIMDNGDYNLPEDMRQGFVDYLSTSIFNWSNVRTRLTFVTKT